MLTSIHRQTQLENREKILECPISYRSFAEADDVVVTVLGTSYERKEIENDIERQKDIQDMLWETEREDEIKPLVDPCILRELTSETLRPNRAIMYVAKHEIKQLTEEKTNAVLGAHIHHIESLIIKLQDQLMAQQSHSLKKLPIGLSAKEITTGLFCPLSLRLLCDPVITPEGITYERAMITDWINEQGSFDPFTQTRLMLDDLVPNTVLKNLIETFNAEDQQKLGINACKHTIKSTQNWNHLATVYQIKNDLQQKQKKLRLTTFIAGGATLLTGTWFLVNQIIACRSATMPSDNVVSINDLFQRLSGSSDVALLPTREVEPFSSSLVCHVLNQIQPVLFAQTVAEVVQDTMIDTISATTDLAIGVLDRMYFAILQTVPRTGQLTPPERIAYIRYLTSPLEYSAFRAWAIEQDPRYAAWVRRVPAWDHVDTLVELFEQLEQGLLDDAKIPDLSAQSERHFLEKAMLQCIENKQFHLIEHLQFLQVEWIDDVLNNIVQNIFEYKKVEAFKSILQNKSLAEKAFEFVRDLPLAHYAKTKLFYLEHAAFTQAVRLFEAMIKKVRIEKIFVNTFQLLENSKIVTVLQKLLSHVSHESVVDTIHSSLFLCANAHKKQNTSFFNPRYKQQDTILVLAFNQMIANLEKSIEPVKLTEELVGLIRLCPLACVEKLVPKLPISFSEVIKQALPHFETKQPAKLSF
jgi:hypothetical protein